MVGWRCYLSKVVSGEMLSMGNARVHLWPVVKKILLDDRHFFFCPVGYANQIVLWYVYMDEMNPIANLDTKPFL